VEAEKNVGVSDMMFYASEEKGGNVIEIHRFGLVEGPCAIACQKSIGGRINNQTPK
jgi:hypothetical protein